MNLVSSTTGWWAKDSPYCAEFISGQMKMYRIYISIISEHWDSACSKIFPLGRQAQICLT